MPRQALGVARKTLGQQKLGAAAKDARHYCLSSVASTLPLAGIYKGALEYFDPPVLVYVLLGQNRFSKTQISANCGFHICPQGFLGGHKLPAGAKAEA